jgi:hypothetical protein
MLGIVALAAIILTSLFVVMMRVTTAYRQAPRPSTLSMWISSISNRSNSVLAKLLRVIESSFSGVATIRFELTRSCVSSSRVSPVISHTFSCLKASFHYSFFCWHKHLMGAKYAARNRGFCSYCFNNASSVLPVAVGADITTF